MQDANLAELIQEDVEATEQAAQESPTMDRLMSLAAEMDELKAEKKDLEDQAKERGKRISELEVRLIPDLMDTLGIRSLVTDFGKRLGQRTDTYVNVKAGDKPTLLDWLKAEGHGSVVKEDVHSSTLKALVRDLIEEGVDLPTFISTYTETKATLTKA